MATNTPASDIAAVVQPGLANDEMLTAGETASLLKVPLSWVYEHVRPSSGDRLPFVKLGKYLRFHRHDLQTYIAEKRGQSLRNPHRR